MRKQDFLCSIRIQLLLKKMKKDDEFFQNEDRSYIYGTAFTEAKNINSVLQLENTELLKNVSTLICEYTEEKPVLSYCSDFVTLQSVTSDGMNYTYSDDIRMRSIQSALGYTNVMLNMYDIFWPQKDTDRWGNNAEAFFQQPSHILERVFLFCKYYTFRE